jgi:hypothetical protein
MLSSDYLQVELEKAAGSNWLLSVGDFEAPMIDRPRLDSHSAVKDNSAIHETNTLGLCWGVASSEDCVSPGKRPDLYHKKHLSP